MVIKWMRCVHPQKYSPTQSGGWSILIARCCFAYVYLCWRARQHCALMAFTLPSTNTRESTICLTIGCNVSCEFDKVVALPVHHLFSYSCRPEVLSSVERPRTSHMKPNNQTDKKTHSSHSANASTRKSYQAMSIARTLRRRCIELSRT